MRFNLGGSRKAIEATCNCACEPRWEDADGLEDLTNGGFPDKDEATRVAVSLIAMWRWVAAEGCGRQ